MAGDDTSPISLASIIIGFISFAFTLSTFFKVIANNLDTIAAAPQQAPFALINLKQELFEERVHLRRARRAADRRLRRHRKYGSGPLPGWDSAPAIGILEANVRKLWREFRELEKPFLAASEPVDNLRDDREIDTFDRRGRGSKGRSKHQHQSTQRYATGNGNGIDDHRHSGDSSSKTLEEGKRDLHIAIADDYLDGGFVHDYASITLTRRFAWLTRKSQVEKLSTDLAKLQLRRVGRETTDALNEIKRIKFDLQELKLIPGDESGGGGGGGGGGGTTTGEVGRTPSLARPPAAHTTHARSTHTHTHTHTHTTNHAHRAPSPSSARPARGQGGEYDKHANVNASVVNVDHYHRGHPHPHRNRHHSRNEGASTSDSSISSSDSDNDDEVNVEEEVSVDGLDEKTGRERGRGGRVHVRRTTRYRVQ